MSNRAIYDNNGDEIFETRPLKRRRRRRAIPRQPSTVAAIPWQQTPYVCLPDAILGRICSYLPRRFAINVIRCAQRRIGATQRIIDWREVYVRDLNTICHVLADDQTWTRPEWFTHCKSAMARVRSVTFPTIRIADVHDLKEHESTKIHFVDYDWSRTSPWDDHALSPVSLAIGAAHIALRLNRTPWPGVLLRRVEIAAHIANVTDLGFYMPRIVEHANDIVTTSDWYGLYDMRPYIHELVLFCQRCRFQWIDANGDAVVLLDSAREIAEAWSGW